MRIVAFAALVAMSGCTIVGAGAGAGYAAINNATIPERVDQGRESVGKDALIGAAVGLVIDAIIVYEVGKTLAEFGR